MFQIELLLAGFTDSSGNPLAAGKVYTYEAGTTTDKTTYQDADGGVAHANPIILDSQGRKLAYADGIYKFVIKDSDDNTLYTFDDLSFGSEYSPGTYWAGTASLSTNAFSATLSPAILAYETGLRVSFKAGGAITGAATLNLNSLGAKNITKANGDSLVSGEIASNQIVEAVYDGTSFRIISGLVLAPAVHAAPLWGGAASFSSNAYSISMSPSLSSYTTGLTVRFSIANANTAAATLNINSLGAKTLKRSGGGDLYSGFLVSGMVVEAVYDGTNFIIISPTDASVTTSTPTLTGIANLTTLGAYAAFVTRNKDYVEVSGKIDIDVTAAGVLTSFRGTLPYTSDLVGSDLFGVIVGPGTGAHIGNVQADVANNLAYFELWPQTTATNTAYFYKYCYQVK
jgi:hypothetical protein